MLFSVIITVRNEADNIADLLDSLVRQDVNKEVIVVDSDSEDGTADVVRDYARKYNYIHLFVRGSRRGEGRNIAISKAQGDAYAFIDGDCIADSGWLAEVEKSMSSPRVVAGKTVYIGQGPYIGLERVELYRRGLDVTYPSCNLVYHRDVVKSIGEFDRWFITAEDIDLNIRAVDGHFPVTYNEEAVVYHKTRENLYSFSKQAFWNGAGRKQLTLKYGRLWSSYKPLELLRRKMTVYAMLRVFMALLGYVGYKLFGSRRVSQVSENT